MRIPCLRFLAIVSLATVCSAQDWVRPAITLENPPSGSFAPGLDPAVIQLDICQIQTIPHPNPPNPGDTLIAVSICGANPFPGTAGAAIGSGVYNPVSGALTWDTPANLPDQGNNLQNAFSLRLNPSSCVDDTGTPYAAGAVCVYDFDGSNLPKIATRSAVPGPWNPVGDLSAGSLAGYVDSTLVVLNGVLHFSYVSGGIWAAPLNVAARIADTSRAVKLVDDESTAIHNGMGSFSHSPTPLRGIDGDDEAMAHNNTGPGNISPLFFQARMSVQAGTGLGSPDPANFPITTQTTSWQNNGDHVGGTFFTASSLGGYHVHTVDACMMLGDDERGTRGQSGRTVETTFLVPLLDQNAVTDWFCFLMIGTRVLPTPIPGILGELIVFPGSLGVPILAIGTAPRETGVVGISAPISSGDQGTLDVQGLVGHFDASNTLILALTNNAQIHL